MPSKNSSKTKNETKKSSVKSTATKAKEEKKEVKTTNKPKSKFGLGHGLNTLIPAVEEKKEDDNIIEASIVTEAKTVETLVNINEIEPNPNQPRRKFDEDALGELADSIKQHGLIQPIVVQKKDKMYQIIAGERRWRACRIAKIKEVPVIVKDLSDKEQYEIALIENIQREDLNDIEEAYAYKALIEEFNLKQDEVAERVSKSRVAITNALRLLKLNPKVQELVISGLISGGHARALLSLPDGELQYDVAMKIVDEKLSVRETEKLVKAMTNKKPVAVRKTIESDAVYRQYEENLRSILGSKVEIKQNGENKGKIVIEYNSTDEFEKIFDIIKR